MKEFKIGSKLIGLEQPIFISAEVGTTSNGDVKTAKGLIDAAKDAGMDAVKFQILDPEDKFSQTSIPFTFTRHTGEVVQVENLKDMLKKYVMPKSAWREIVAYGKKKNMIVFATPDYEAGVDLMEELDMPAYKIATWDATFFPMVRKIARTGKPIIVDLGASDLEEVASVVKVIQEEKNQKVILLHCFHTHDFAQMNLRTIEYLRDTFGYFSGFSAPDRNSDIDYASLAYHPVYIEKRLTLDRKDPNHHHAQALEPEEMKAYVRSVRALQSAIGSYKLAPTDADKKMRGIHFRSLVAKRPIKTGEVLSLKNVALRRPYYAGLDPRYLDVIIGRKAKKSHKTNEPITWDSL